MGPPAVTKSCVNPAKNEKCEKEGFFLLLLFYCCRGLLLSSILCHKVVIKKLHGNLSYNKIKDKWLMRQFRFCWQGKDGWPLGGLSPVEHCVWKLQKWSYQLLLLLEAFLMDSRGSSCSCPIQGKEWFTAVLERRKIEKTISLYVLLTFSKTVKQI